MTQVTSLPLSKELWEKGLRIETEKWHNNQGLGHYHIGYFRPDMSEFPAYQTDELLAVLFTSPIARIGMTPNSVWDDSAVKIIPMSSYGEIPEALGKMCLWLLDNGYKYSEEKKCLEKQ